MRDDKTIVVKVRRQDGAHEAPRWEQFVVRRRRNMTVADALEAIAQSPRTDSGASVVPIAWASSCTYPACGGCAMVINGQAGPACTSLVDVVAPKKMQPLVLAPLAAFPVHRDLWVDRSRLRSDAARLGAFTSSDVPPPPSANLTLERFSRCTRCGACVEACPEAGPGRAFVGPHALGAAHAAHAAGAEPAIAALTSRGGIQECGNAQNCLEVCPEGIPLDEAIGALSRLGARGWLRSLLGR